MSVKTTRNTNPKENRVNNIPTDITLVYHVQGAMHKPDSMAPVFPPIKESKAVCGPQVLYSRGPYPEHRRNSIQLGARSTSTALAPDSRVAASHARITSDIKGAASPKSHTPHAKSDQLGVAGETSVQGNQEADDQPRDVGYDKVKGQEEVNRQDTSTGCVPLERRDDSGTETVDLVDDKVEDGAEIGTAAIEQRIQGPSAKSRSRALIKKLSHCFIPGNGKVLRHSGGKQESIIRTHMDRESRDGPDTRQTTVLSNREAERIEVKEPKKPTSRWHRHR